MCSKLKNQLKIFVLVLCQVLYVSACSNVFQYFPDNLGGTFQVRHQAGVNMTLRLELSIDGQVQGRGSLQPAFDLMEVDRRLRERRPIPYIVKFPRSFQTPRVTKIVKNNEVICTEPYVPNGGYMFSLTHTLFYPVDVDAGNTGTFNPTSPAINPLNSCPACPACPACRQCERCQPCRQQPVQVQNPIKNRVTTTNEDDDLAKCGRVPRATGLVRKGQSVNKGQWPWQTAIFVFKVDPSEVKMAFKCAGTLISERIVLSAAHCFKTDSGSVDKKDVTVVLGQHDIDDWGNRNILTRQPLDIINSGDYDSISFEADISLLKLEIIRLSNYIRPACLWERDTNIDDMVGQVGVVVGWGRDENGLFTKKPKSANVTVIRKDECKRSHDSYSLLTSGSFCGKGVGDTSVCAGDSGGGLLFFTNNAWTLRGVVSSKAPDDPNSDRCDAVNYDIYTDVAKYLPWIKSNM